MDQTPQKTITLTFSDESFAELSQLSAKFNRPIPDLISNGLALVKLVLEEEEMTNKLLIATPQGKAIREIVLPKRPQAALNLSPDAKSLPA
jgi:hypothetical protein